MSVIIQETHIEAPIEIVFDLARSIDFHIYSTHGTKEKAVSGRTSGLMELDETVTWRAMHLGICQELTSQITGFKRPFLFADTMVKGVFAYMHHVHIFGISGTGTLMKDTFEFRSPLGIVGKLFDWIFLRQYMAKFLKIRNEELKKVAETEKWKQFLD